MIDPPSGMGRKAARPHGPASRPAPAGRVSRWADYTGGTIVVSERKGSALGVPRGGAAIEGRPPRWSLRRRSPIEDRAAIRRSDLLETTMNNAELAETSVANHNSSKADARKVVDDVMAAIVAAAVKGDEVSLS
ncbi:hypothetical protein OY671_010090, partial [Metschnikowia pulcherrima]